MSFESIKTDVQTWLNRTDLNEVMPMIVGFAENKFNDKLRLSPMEKDYAPVNLVGGKANLPADFLAFKYVKTNERTLKVATTEYIKSKQNNASMPIDYAIDGNTIICYPSAGTIEGVYYAKIPPIESSSTNWLDDARHDLYVYECLGHICLFIKDLEASQRYFAMADTIMKDMISVNNARQISGSPLVGRNR